MDLRWAVEDWVRDLATCPITRFSVADAAQDLGVEDIAAVQKCLDGICADGKLTYLPKLDVYEISQAYKEHERRQESKRKLAGWYR